MLKVDGISGIEDPPEDPEPIDIPNYISVEGTILGTVKDVVQNNNLVDVGILFPN